MRVALLIVAILLAGCVLPATPDEDPTAEAPRLAGYHVALPAVGEATSSLFAMRTDGTALRLTYVDEGRGDVRVDAALVVSRAELDVFFRTTNLNRSAGASIVKVESGLVPHPARGALLSALNAPWDAGPRQLDDPRGHDYVQLASDGSFQVVRTPPVPPGFESVVDAFASAEAAFVALQTEESPRFLMPTPSDDGPCLALEMRPSKEAVRVGELLEMNALVTNCGHETVTLGLTSCDPAPHLSVAVVLPGGFGRVLAPSDEPQAAYALDGRCRGEGGTVSLPAGASHATTRIWNGTIGACDAAGACHYEQQQDRLGLAVSVPGHEQSAWRSVLILPGMLTEAAFLLVRQHDWVNTTSSKYIPADFGPHCAHASYTLDAPSITLHHQGEEPPAAPEALVIRDWREGERPSRAMSWSSDRRQLVTLEGGGATLVSPFAAGHSQAHVAYDGEAFVVQGERLLPGDAWTLRVEHVVHHEGERYDTVSVLLFEHVGMASVYPQPFHGCH